MTKRELAQAQKEERAQLLETVRTLEQLSLSPVIVVEDGSVDTDELEDLGFRVIVYRQGTHAPIVEPLEDTLTRLHLAKILLGRFK